MGNQNNLIVVPLPESDEQLDRDDNMDTPQSGVDSLEMMTTSPEEACDPRVGPRSQESQSLGGDDVAHTMDQKYLKTLSEEKQHTNYSSQTSTTSETTMSSPQPDVELESLKRASDGNQSKVSLSNNQFASIYLLLDRPQAANKPSGGWRICSHPRRILLDSKQQEQENRNPHRPYQKALEGHPEEQPQQLPVQW